MTKLGLEKMYLLPKSLQFIYAPEQMASQYDFLFLVLTSNALCGTQMEIQTAVGASSSSCMQLSEQINTIKRKTDKLSITKYPYEISKEEYDKFINKTKQEINHFTQLIREVISSISFFFSSVLT